jgi:CheY-like chemotaxis protein
VRVVVVHYEPAEALALAERLRRDGIAAEPYLHVGTRGLRDLRANPPDAILIDLMRMPSYGRAMGAMLRETRSTRAIPLVFLEGDPEKTARVRDLLPDALFATFPRLKAVIERAIRRPPADPVVPDRAVPIAKKLRLRDGVTVALIGAPTGFESTLGGAKTTRSGNGDVVLLFVKSAAALGRDLPRFASLERGRALWILWPKRASGVAADVSLPRIHEACAPFGLVAYKTCSIDDTWSAAAIAPRRTRRA